MRIKLLIMNTIKFSKIYFKSGLLLSLLILSGCKFYKTLEIAPVTDGGSGYFSIEHK
jgi:hypothetical protein